MGLSAVLWGAVGRTHGADGEPDLQVAEDDDGEGEEAARDHQHHHVGLHPRVGAAAEHIRAARRLQAVGTIPAGGCGAAMGRCGAVVGCCGAVMECCGAAMGYRWGMYGVAMGHLWVSYGVVMGHL